VVAVAPSPVPGATAGTGFTVRVALADTPLPQSISGWYRPGWRLAGSVTVVTNSLPRGPACIGMCSLSPSVVPIKVAEVAGLTTVSDAQLTVNVVDVLGAAGSGVMTTGGEWAGAAGGASASTAMSSPPGGTARRTRRMRSPGPEYTHVITLSNNPDTQGYISQSAALRAASRAHPAGRLPAHLPARLRARKHLRHNDVVKYVGSTAARAGTAHGAGLSAAPAQPGSERGTRAQIARLILENGPVTAAGLSTRLNLTPAAVRRHLDNLLADGMIETRSARRPASRGRGRPAKLFAITDVGRSAFEHAYDDLATGALRFLAEVAGPAAVAEFAHRQVADLENRYRPVVEAAPAGERVSALAEALSADGYAASASRVPAAASGEQLCQHHCPVAHVAAEFPQLCEAETEAFARLLGTPVQRLATIARGDGICTTHVTAPALLHSTHGSTATK
jgi:predicted ArsR family transcriptional regulator